jgi:cytochrome c
MMRTMRVAFGALLLTLASCDVSTPKTVVVAGGDPHRGEIAIREYGCAACHTIAGISGSKAQVGPELAKFAARTYIAGVLPNSAQNLVRWIRDPPSVDPLTAMPNLNVSEASARDIASYLYAN